MYSISYFIDFFGIKRIYMFLVILFCVIYLRFWFVGFGVGILESGCVLGGGRILMGMRVFLFRIYLDEYRDVFLGV